MKNNAKFVITNIVKDSLYSIKYEGSDDEFSSFFNKLQDIEFLFNFFSNNENDLKRGFFGKFNYNIENAISCTIDESEELEDLILDIAEDNRTESYEKLDTYFKPLFKSEIEKYPPPEYQKCKMYGEKKPSWIRLYGIRLEANVFIITGGAIKLTKKMQGRSHTERELRKLEDLKDYLIENGIIDKLVLEELIKNTNE